MQKKEGFVVPLGVHSYFSLLRGVFSPEEIAADARTAGWAAVGLADVNNFYGLVRFLSACREGGVKPVVGAALETGGRPLASAFVRNAAGFRRLSALLSLILTDVTARRYFPDRAAGRTEAELDGDLRRRLTEDLLEKGWDGLALASDDPGLLDALRARGAVGLSVKLAYGRPFARLAAWGEARGLPGLAVVEGAVRTERDAKLYRILRAVDLSVNVDSLPREERSPQRLPEPERAAAFYSAVPGAVRNTRSLVEESSAAGVLSDRPVFPAFCGLSPEEEFARLRARCLTGLDRRYPAAERGPARSRLDYELSIIGEKGFAGYFLVVHDIVRRCPRTCGRGSAASSIVSYLLGITHVDPLRHNLFFERFLNRGRRDPPDIDVDFPWDEREKALRYVFERYRGRAGMVADHVTFGPRSSLREPAKALGVSEPEIKRLVRFRLAGERDRIPAELLDLADTLRGVPRTIGTHPGGVVITPGPITDHVPVQVSALGWPLIAWEKDAVEAAGLVKIDLLGNRSLGVLRDSIRLVNERRGESLSWRRFDPTADPAVERFIASGDTVGIFYIESPATRQLLRKMGKADFENLVIASSIIRPAANRYIEEFVKRLHGKPYLRLHPAFDDTLKDTYGIMVYQEDVSRVAIALAGFGTEDADMLRKILAKKGGSPKLAQFKERFVSGAVKAGVTAAEADAVWDMILSFDGYSFCKPHSASYAQVSYRLAWLKLHYPIEFLASVINNGGGFYTRQTYLDEVRRRGFAVLPPDVNSSGLEYTVENGGLRIGLLQLADVKRPFLEKLVSERRARGPFVDFFNFCRRTGAGYPEIRVLIKSGALDSVSNGRTRPELFFLFFQLDARSGARGERAPRTQADFGFFPPRLPDCVSDYSAQARLRAEVESLGLVASRHPMSLFTARAAARAGRFPGLPLIGSADLPRFVGRRAAIAGTIVTGKEVRTRVNTAMMFVSFEDEHAVFETVFFPEVYARHRFLLQQAAAFLIVGTVKDDLGALSVQVEEAVRLTRDPDRLEESWDKKPVELPQAGAVWGGYYY
ncbi:MAG: DNA polymerase III subunit alpha [Spirochaetales bacterium]|nr:DNA polymerase III subunit alpha [Spirochaetales bacterium]